MKEPAGLALIIPGREKDLGGFHVRRVLPYASHRMVGPFIFFDHMGPAEFPPGEGLTVRPHPHINLATVTYLFAGSILHRDSLGSEQLIEPGAINWMTAGRGIVHSERSHPEVRRRGGPLHGIQCWVALPEEKEEVEPDFTHHPATSIPEFTVGRARLRLLAGSAFERASPVKLHSDLIYVEARLPAGETLRFPAGHRDLAAYPISGRLRVNGEDLPATSMAIGHGGQDLLIEATEEAHLMIFGGEPLAGGRFIWWNFVSSSRDRIVSAREDWREGRFPKIPGDDEEFIPLPDDPLPAENPKGTIL